MSHSPEPTSKNQQPPLEIPLKHHARSQSLQEEALKHVVTMKFQSLSPTPIPSSPHSSEPDLPSSSSSSLSSLDQNSNRFNALLSDELLLSVLSRVSLAHYPQTSLVCKRWLYLHGRFVKTLKVLDWGFLDSGRVADRFPNLTDVDVVRACLRSPRNSGIVVTTDALSLSVDSLFVPSSGGFVEEDDVLRPSVVDQGLRMIANWYPNLRRLAAIGASEAGLRALAEECLTLQELELHCCGDSSLKGISGCKNLQIVKLIAFQGPAISDVGLTILAHGLTRLVKLELCGCEGSYDGVKAVGQCCLMLEELTLRNHGMDGGWLSGLSYCGNLKTLRLESCKEIDSSPGPEEHLGSCPAVEELHLERCSMRSKRGVQALFTVCEGVRDLVLRDCWGLMDDVFALAAICRRVKLISLEGCSLLTTGGLEAVLLSWKELQRLQVVSCNNVKDVEISPDLASLFSILKELKWRPDSKSLLTSSLAGTGVGSKGGRFFKRLKP